MLNGILDEAAGTRRGLADLLALRRQLDRAIRSRITWPREHEYTLIAGDMERLGWLEHAATLRDLAGTDQLISHLARQWDGRYQDRGPAIQDLDTDRTLASEHTELADADPVPGIDGAMYRRGYIDAAGGGHIILVQGRGLSELIRFGHDETTCERWAASRGPLAAGPLDPPPPVLCSRTWQEEQLLAAMLSDPATLARYRRQFPPGTFTADSRYEIYCTLLELADTSRRWYPWQAGNRVAARQDQIPASQLGTYGGDGMPWVRTYLDRLTATTWTPAAAAAAAHTITTQDRAFRGGAHAIDAERPAGRPATRPGPSPGSAPPLARPPQPGETAGPVPHL